MHLHKSPNLFYLLSVLVITAFVITSITSCQSATPTLEEGQVTGSSVPSPGAGQQNVIEAPSPTSEQPSQGLTSPGTPAVLGFVLDPDGAPVPYALVGDEMTDINGAVSGELTVSPSGWLEIKSLGYASAYAKPGNPIHETGFFESRLTPYQAFILIAQGEQVTLTVGTTEQALAEFTVDAGALSSLPAYIEASRYDLAEVGPGQASLDNGEVMDLALALAIEGSTVEGSKVSVASGKTVTFKVLPDANLAASPTLAIFNPQVGVWQIQAGACVPGIDAGLLCTIPQFSSHIGLFVPHVEAALPKQRVLQGLAALKRIFRPSLASDDQAYQDALTNALEWGRIMEGELMRTGSNSPESQQEMADRLGKLTVAAEAYAAAHPDASAVSHLLTAYDLATAFGELDLAARLLKDAIAIVEKMADDLLKDPNCARIREMVNVMTLLTMVGGSSAKADAMLDKIQKLSECDEWIGHINVTLNLSGTNPGLEKLTLESGFPMWTEDHRVMMATNVNTFVLRGEDTIKLNFGEVKYGKYDRDNCHNYLTHGVEGGDSILMKFDGSYDGYTFSVGDLQPQGGSATITYGAHAERYNDEKDECETYADEVIPAPNYTTLLLHGFSGSPPITIQEMLEQGGNLEITGGMPITNGAYDLGIIPAEDGYIRWYFRHIQRFLPMK
jgi:hypothetical protein